MARIVDSQVFYGKPKKNKWASYTNSIAPSIMGLAGPIGQAFNAAAGYQASSRGKKDSARLLAQGASAVANEWVGKGKPPQEKPKDDFFTKMSNSEWSDTKAKMLSSGDVTPEMKKWISGIDVKRGQTGGSALGDMFVNMEQSPTTPNFMTQPIYQPAISSYQASPYNNYSNWSTMQSNSGYNTPSMNTGYSPALTSYFGGY